MSNHQAVLLIIFCISFGVQCFVLGYQVGTTREIQRKQLESLAILEETQERLNQKTRTLFLDEPLPTNLD